jgi:hypothetical protein
MGEVVENPIEPSIAEEGKRSSVRDFFAHHMLATDEINRILDGHERTMGMRAFPSDRVPAHKSSSYGFVLNTQPNSHPGEHWVACAYDAESNVTFFFDSAGNTPEAYNKRWSRALRSRGRRFVMYSCKAHQNIGTDTCGLWCVYFLHICFANKHVGTLSLSDDRMLDYTLKHYAKPCKVIYNNY